MMPEWTSDCPTAPGFYWTRAVELRGRPVVVELDAEGYLWLGNQPWYRDVEGDRWWPVAVEPPEGT